MILSVIRYNKASWLLFNFRIALLFLPTPVALGGKNPAVVLLEERQICLFVSNYEPGRIDHGDLINFEDDRQPEMVAETGNTYMISESMTASKFQ